MLEPQILKKRQPHIHLQWSLRPLAAAEEAEAAVVVAAVGDIVHKSIK